MRWWSINCLAANEWKTSMFLTLDLLIWASRLRENGLGDRVSPPPHRVNQPEKAITFSVSFIAIYTVKIGRTAQSQSPEVGICICSPCTHRSDLQIKVIKPICVLGNVPLSHHAWNTDWIFIKNKWRYPPVTYLPSLKAKTTFISDLNRYYFLITRMFGSLGWHPKDVTSLISDGPRCIYQIFR